MWKIKYWWYFSWVIILLLHPIYRITCILLLTNDITLLLKHVNFFLISLLNFLDYVFWIECTSFSTFTIAFLINPNVIGTMSILFFWLAPTLHLLWHSLFEIVESFNVEGINLFMFLANDVGVSLAFKDILSKKYCSQLTSHTSCA